MRLGHVLVASMMALPAAVMLARIMVPGDAATEEVPTKLEYRSSMDAVAKGTEDGLKIYLQIMALLIVMVALISLADQILAALPHLAGAADHSGAGAGLAVRAAGLALWRALARGGRGGKSAGHQGRSSTNWWPICNMRACRPARSIRAPA